MDTGLQDLGCGVTREPLDNGRIIAYTMVGRGRDLTDTWVTHLISDLKTLQPTQTYLYLLDFSQAGMSFYGNQRAQEIPRHVPAGVRVHYALVVADTILGHSMVSIARVVALFSSHFELQYQIFHTRPEALAWLQEFL